jgi:hypothetical protein
MLFHDYFMVKYICHMWNFPEELYVHTRAQAMCLGVALKFQFSIRDWISFELVHHYLCRTVFMAADWTFLIRTYLAKHLHFFVGRTLC